VISRKVIIRLVLSLAIVLVLLITTVILVVRSRRFGNYVRERLVSYIERSTGGKTQINSFRFDWHTLTVTIAGLTIRGTESAANPPLFEAPQIVLRLKLFSLGHAVDLAYLGVDRPSVNILVFPNHQTNLPAPQKPSAGLQKDLRSVIDLAIQRFDITNGTIHFADLSVPLTLHGSDFLASLYYDRAQTQYRGQISTSMITQYRSVITSRVVVPVSIGRDTITVTNARLTTPRSNLVANARLFNVASAQALVDVSAHVSLADLQMATGAPIHLNSTGPQYVNLRTTLTAASKGIVLQYASLDLGKSYIIAAGDGNTEASFHGSISFDELSHLFAAPQLPAGTLTLSGQGNLVFPDYSVRASFASHDLSFKYDHIGEADLSGLVAASPALIQLSQLDLHVMGTSLSAKAAIHDLRTVVATANFRGLSVSQASEIGFHRNLGYSGSISCSLQARGPIRAPSISADLSVVPIPTGVPLSGRLQADYNSSTRIIAISHSHFVLPHSRIEVSGQPGRQALLTIHSRNVVDFSPLLATLFPSHPIALTSGLASLSLTERGPLDHASLSGSADLTNFVVDGRRFDTLTASVNASPSELHVTSATLDRGASHVGFSFSLGLDHWRSRPTEPLAAELTIRNGRLSDFLSLVGEQTLPLEGQVTSAVHLSGTLDNPRGDVAVHITNGTIYNDAFSDASIAADLSDRLITVKTFDVTTPAGELHLQASFAHPPTDLTKGKVRAQVNTSAIDLSRVATLQSYRPGFAGTLQIRLSVEGTLFASQKIWSASFIRGDLVAANLRDHTHDYGDLSLAANTQAGIATVRLASTVAGSATELNGSVHLSADFPFTADLKVGHMSLAKLGSLFDVTRFPASGTLDCIAHLSGTPAAPVAAARFQLAKGNLFAQPIDRLSGNVNYQPTFVQVSALRAVIPAGSVNVDASFSHSASDLREGRAELHVSTDGLNLAKVDEIQKLSPGLKGVLYLNGGAIAELRRTGDSEQILPLSLDANASVHQLAVIGEPSGDLTLQAHTTNRVTTFDVTSNLAQASAHVSGAVGLQPGYPAKVDASFTNVTYAGIAPLIGYAPLDSLHAVADGHARFEGSLSDPQASTGQLQLTRLEVSPAKQVTFRNQGTVTLTLNHGSFSITAARITGLSTDITVAGTVALNSKTPMNLAIRSNADLAVLKTFFPGAMASGTVDVNASLRGTLNAPNFSGRLQLTGGSFQRVSWPNGIYDANALVLLSGSGGQIQSFTAQSGGGKVAVTGFFSLANSTLTYHLQTDARQVRTRYSGASVTANAQLTLSGTSRAGLLTGAVTISRVGYGQQSDIGSILSAATKPPAPPSAAAGPFSTIRARVQIRTATNVLFQTTLAQQLAATADLTLLGSLQNPGMVGRINITSGALVFFSNKYSVNRGVISFYDATTIQPVLDIDMETNAQGVDVNLTVSGPMDNLKLTYRSDPPLKFEDIIALLAAGKTPPDPTIASNQPLAPDQGAMQMGESALVGAAIANPVASQLQRVFGVTQFTIAPTFVSGTALPQARVILQQQVTQDVTLTYSQDLSQSNAELVRIEWELDPRFSAVATRDENGIFSIDFFWKKQFH